MKCADPKCKSESFSVLIQNPNGETVVKCGKCGKVFKVGGK